jgi:hypothetical protein
LEFRTAVIERSTLARRTTTYTFVVWMLGAGLGLRAAGLLLAQEPFEEFSCTSFPAELSKLT